MANANAQCPFSVYTFHNEKSTIYTSAKSTFLETERTTMYGTHTIAAPSMWLHTEQPAVSYWG